MSEGGMMIIRKNDNKQLYIVSVFAGTEEGALGYHPMFDSFVNDDGKINILDDFQEK
ncbi:MAG: hypothetical protein MJ200_02725 [Mycoplasmoidaceae bacterium]|nr:hypothetical protein [Mycoplasmoidaceae bacterium]